jgi:cytidylate kinase
MTKTYIEFLKPYEKQLSKEVKKKGLTITVSGRSGSGKSLGARAIAKALKLRYICAGKILRAEAKRRKIPLEQLCKTREAEIDYIIDKRTLEFAMKGRVVLDGRLSGWVAGGWSDAKVFYDCPLKVRAERVAKRDNISVEEAKRRLAERDNIDRKRYMELYGIDFFDKSIYDIIVKNEKLTKREVKRVSITLVRKQVKKILGEGNF